VMELEVKGTCMDGKDQIPSVRNGCISSYLLHYTAAKKRYLMLVSYIDLASSDRFVATKSLRAGWISISVTISYQDYGTRGAVF
jgi:hypothetical protein